MRAAPSLRPRSAVLHGLGGVGGALPPVPRARPGSSQSSLRRVRGGGGGLGPTLGLGRSKSALGGRRGRGSGINHAGAGSAGTLLHHHQFSSSSSSGGGGATAANSGRSLEANLASSFSTLGGKPGQLRVARVGHTTIQHAAGSTGSTGSTGNLAASAAQLQAATSSRLGNHADHAAAAAQIRPSDTPSAHTDTHSDEEEDRLSTTNSARGTPSSSALQDTPALLPATALAAALLSENGAANHAAAGAATAATSSSSDEPVSNGTLATSASVNGSLGRNDNANNRQSYNYNQPRPRRSASVGSFRHPQSTANRLSRRRPPSAGSVGGHNPAYRLDASTAAFAANNKAANARRPNTAPDRDPGGTAPGHQLSPNKDDLRRENSMLRVQMERMRMQSFKKIRGGKRFVSGGGFRAARNHEDNNVGGNVRAASRNASHNNEIQHLKNQIRQLTADKQRLEQELAEANMRLNRCIQNQKTLFNQVKAVELERDRLQETINQRERLITDQVRVVSLCMSLEALAYRISTLIHLSFPFPDDDRHNDWRRKSPSWSSPSGGSARSPRRFAACVPNWQSWPPV